MPLQKQPNKLAFFFNLFKPELIMLKFSKVALYFAIFSFSLTLPLRAQDKKDSEINKTQEETINTPRTRAEKVDLNKIDKDVSKNVGEILSETEMKEKEKRLLAELKKDEKNLDKLYEIGSFYFPYAVKYDMLHLWGDKENEEIYEEKVKHFSLKAIKYFKKYVKIDKTNSKAYSKLCQSLGIRMRNGSFWLIFGNLGKFNKTLDMALKLNPNEFEALITDAYRTLYTPSLIKNRKELAKKQFEALLKKHPNNPHVLKGLAITYQRMDKFETALKYIEQTLKLAPEDLEAIGIKKQIVEEIEKAKE